MNDVTNESGKQVALRQETTPEVGGRWKSYQPVQHDNWLYDTSRFEHMIRVASLMAESSLVPAHLLGNSAREAQANCFGVVNQARLWNVDPFALAQSTFSLEGKLGYEGKAVAAVIIGKLGRVFRHEYFGEFGKPSRGIRMWIKLDGVEQEPIVGTVERWATKTKDGNYFKPAWVKTPDEMLYYRAIRATARIYTPDILMGVTVVDEGDVEPAVEIQSGPPPIPALPAAPPRKREPKAPTTIDATPVKEEPAKAEPEPVNQKPADDKREPDPVKPPPADDKPKATFVSTGQSTEDKAAAEANAERLRDMKKLEPKEEAKREPAQQRRADPPKEENPPAPMEDSGPSAARPEEVNRVGPVELLDALRAELSLCRTPEEAQEAYTEMDVEAELSHHNVPGAIDKARKMLDDRKIELLPPANAGSKPTPQEVEHAKKQVENGETYMARMYQMVADAKTPADVLAIRNEWKATKNNRTNYGVPVDDSTKFVNALAAKDQAIGR